MPMNKSIQKAIEIVGSQSELARRIGAGCKQQNVWRWLHMDYVPADRCIQIEAATEGQVRVEDLRPDVPWHVIRKG